MFLIAHRGNTDGPDPKNENTIAHIYRALEKKYDVEIDVRVEDGRIFLGHDRPQEEVDLEWLSYYKLWVHAKNHSAVEMIMNWNLGKFNNPIHFFWHQKDDMVLTSKRIVWTYPGKPIISGSIAVLPEIVPEWDIHKSIGICSDHISNWKTSRNI